MSLLLKRQMVEGREEEKSKPFKSKLFPSLTFPSSRMNWNQIRLEKPNLD